MKRFSKGSSAKAIIAALPLGGYLPAETWERRHRLPLRLTWFHVAVIALLGPLLGYDWKINLRALFGERTVAHTFGEALLVASFALLAGWRRLHPSLRAAAVGVGSVSASAVFVHTSGGYIELHFHFFVVLTFIALYQDGFPLGRPYYSSRCTTVSWGFLRRRQFSTMPPRSMRHGPGRASTHFLFCGVAWVA